jgi:hypothetical protein
METESYESIRDNSEIIPQPVRVAWIEADQAERMLRDQYDRLAEDRDLNDEARARRANELYEGRREAVERKKRAAKDALIKAAKSAERSSIPTLLGEGPSTTDPTKLLLDQNESNRVVRIIERRKAQGGPFKQDTGAFLREEYARGLEIGGVEGGAVCRGVLRAAQELGVGDDWLPRKDRHRESLDNARRLTYFSELIPIEAPKPPKSLEKAARSSRQQRDLKPMFRPLGGPPMAAGQQSHGGRGSAGRKKK